MKLSITVFVVAIELLSTAWAQSGKPMPLAQLAAYNRPDREKILSAGAKPEGKITWYTSLASERCKAPAIESPSTI